MFNEGSASFQTHHSEREREEKIRDWALNYFHNTFSRLSLRCWIFKSLQTLLVTAPLRFVEVLSRSSVTVATRPEETFQADTSEFKHLSAVGSR